MAEPIQLEVTAMMTNPPELSPEALAWMQAQGGVFATRTCFGRGGQGCDAWDEGGIARTRVEVQR